MKRLFKTFAKAQVSAFLGGIVDYLFMILLTEIYAVYYVFSILISGIFGAFVNFLINRYWAFDQGRVSKMGYQLFKFSLVVSGSILLKAGGTYFITEILAFDYRISRLMTDGLVAFGFNYVLMHFWVFRPASV